MGLQRTNFEYYSKSAWITESKNALRPIKTLAHASSASAIPVLGLGYPYRVKWVQRGYPTHLWALILDQGWLCF